MKVDFTALDSALRSLEDALDPPPRNDRERDGAIQRFEYTFELTWKTAKRVLENSGITSPSPKSVIRDMAQQGWIQDAELWFGFLKARNWTVHTYKEHTAQTVFATVNVFAPECHRLVNELKRNI
jgi:nucleotidyltransferase substrate binding protein (TIGR01987 family)